ncbi:hypothetical protein D9M73_92630 [compost metagenome]
MRNAGEKQGHFVGQHIRQGRATPLVGYVDDVDLRHRLQVLGRNMLRRRNAAGSVAHAVFARIGKKFLDAFHRQFRTNGNPDRGRTHVHHRHEILQRIKRQFFIQHAHDRQVRRHHDQVVAVLRQPRHFPHANTAAGTWLVFDNELLAHLGGQLLRQHPRHDVGHAACGIRHDDAHHLVGERCLGLCRGHAQGRPQQKRGQKPAGRFE